MDMTPRLLLFVLACMAAGTVTAQILPPSARGEKRPPPPAMDSANQIRAGPDLGTPTSTPGAEMGMTTIPRTDAERRGVKNESAAARAAARKRGPGIDSVDDAIEAGAGAAGGIKAAPAGSPLPPQPGSLNPARTSASGASTRTASNGVRARPPASGVHSRAPASAAAPRTAASGAH
jgi:hypothetical protein